MCVPYIVVWLMIQHSSGIFYREILYGDFIIDDWFQALNWPTSNNYCTALRSEKSHTSYTIDQQCASMKDILRFLLPGFLFDRLFIR